MTEILKSLLRPLRDILISSSSPQAASAQTPEERERERNVARVKGFTFLRSMDELLTWDEEEEDLIQRCSVPMIRRPRPVSRGSEKEEEDGEGGRAKTMLIHDFGEAYHAYEASNQCIGIDEPPFSLDSGQLQYTEIFVYFAHYLVSCPPPAWIGWCHGNGVQCLGTFIVEPQMGKEEMGSILERDEGAFVVARALGRMAKWVGFEGWIVNIEGTFKESDWDVEAMVGFLEELKGYGIVVWYVSILPTAFTPL